MKSMIQTIAGACLAVLLGLHVSGVMSAGDQDHGHDHSEDDHEHEEERGPQGGRLLEDGDFSIELTVYELGIPPEFRIYAYHDGESIPPSEFSAEVILTRLGDIREHYEFSAESDYLRSLGAVGEPHSFDVEVIVKHDGESYHWDYENHEGRTTIPDRVAQAAGIATETAGPATLRQTVPLTGTVQANPGNIAEVRARFPGLVRRTFADVGAVVRRGQRLAEIESNESLRPFDLVSPIDGLIVDREIQAGQVTGDEPLFVITDLDQVWVQLDVFGKDVPLVSVGQEVTVTTLGGATTAGTIDWISPLVAHGSQSVRARVVVDNSSQQFRPGQFVQGDVVVAVVEVPLAVKQKALQRFRDFDVVYGKVAETYEVRMLELGRRDGTFVEVHSGIEPGDIYVSDNSYLIKADIEKSGASHDH